MTTEISRQNLIDTIMDLDAENSYKKRLLAVMQDYKDENLNNIQAYILINDILANYDYNVVMPMEDEEIRKKRQQELIKSGTILQSDTSIQNSDDITEVAIKTKTEIGQIFQNGYSEFIRTIGIENLNMKDRKGNVITDLKKVVKGNQKTKTKEIISQYVEIINRSDIKRYAIQIADIFEIPILKDIVNGSGKRGFYKDRIIPIMVKYLLFENNINTTIDKLSKNIGLVNNSFKNKEFEYELKANDETITMTRINKVYSYCRPEQERIIFTALNALQDDYSVISYSKHFLIINADNSTRISTAQEDIKIRKAQKKALEEFGVSRIFNIYQKEDKVKREFYRRVCEILNDKYNFDCIKYYNQIQIDADMNDLRKLDLKFNIDAEQCKILKDELQQHFIEKVKAKIKSDYEHRQKIADMKDSESQKEWHEKNENAEYKKNIPKDIQELIDINVLNDESIKKRMLPKPKPAYRYPENHIEVMNYLCDALLTGK